MIDARKFIFITSLERSGSTLLDLSLGRHPQLVSFGEVARVLLPHDGHGMRGVVNRQCSCGTIVRNCPFWGKVTEKIVRNETELSLYDRYAIFMAVFDEMYGNAFVPVDSSKFIRAIEALREFGDRLDLRILFIVRDVRGWCWSSRKAGKRKTEVPYSVILSRRIREMWKPYVRYNILRHIPFWLPLEWYIRNRRIDSFLQKGGFSVTGLSYERFALNTTDVLANIFQFAGIQAAPMREISNTHIVRGNRMAFDPGRSATICYDSEWLSQLWPQYEAMVWPFVMLKNNFWVYKK